MNLSKRFMNHLTRVGARTAEKVESAGKNASRSASGQTRCNLLAREGGNFLKFDCH